MIYIRVHGRNSGTDSARSNLLAHVCSNYEVMYDNSTQLSKFQIKGENHPDMDAHFDMKKASPSAASMVL